MSDLLYLFIYFHLRRTDFFFFNETSLSASTADSHWSDGVQRGVASLQPAPPNETLEKFLGFRTVFRLLRKRKDFQKVHPLLTV